MNETPTAIRRIFAVVICISIGWIAGDALFPAITMATNGFDDGGWTDQTTEDEIMKPHYNPFLRTANSLIGVIVFVVSVMVWYTLAFLLFKMQIKKMKSPARWFNVSFMSFLLLAYATALICFAPYLAYEEFYDPGVSYISQINSFVVVISLLIWLMVAATLTYLLRGNTRAG